MRKIAKFTALTTLALSGAHLSYADSHLADTNGLRVFGGIGGGMVAPTMQLTDDFATGADTTSDFNTNTNLREGIMLLSGGMRYYFDHWVLGGFVEGNPISNRYLVQDGQTSDSAVRFKTQIYNNYFLNFGGQVGFRPTTNTTFLVSIYGSDASFTLNDRTFTASTTGFNTNTTQNLAGFGAGFGADYRFTQNLLAEVNYRYTVYNQGTGTIGPRRTASGVLPNGVDTFKPVQSMIDLSLVAEF